MKTLKARGGWWEFVEPLRKLEAFRTHGSLRGKPADGNAFYYGRLPTCHVAIVKESDYVVYSWDTPIAWHHPIHGWIMPDEHYSQTTTQHQTKIATAISQL
jgi:hypothetical protein